VEWFAVWPGFDVEDVGSVVLEGVVAEPACYGVGLVSRGAHLPFDVFYAHVVSSDVFSLGVEGFGWHMGVLLRCSESLNVGSGSFLGWLSRHCLFRSMLHWRQSLLGVTALGAVLSCPRLQVFFFGGAMSSNVVDDTSCVTSYACDVDRYVDVDFAVLVTQYSRSTIYRAVRNGEIVARNLKPGGRKLRILESSLKAWHNKKIKSWRE
jgi:predicted DNA-binding transcriptional regulator AlpA